MLFKAKMLAALFAVSVMGLAIFSVPSALAGPGNTCGRESSNGQQLYEAWKSEGVLHEAVKVALVPAGYRRVDNVSLKKWMEEHVFLAPVAKTTVVNDYGCSSGHMIEAGTRVLHKGEKALTVFPTVSKEEFRLKPQKGFKRKKLPSHIVGKHECSNPFAAATQSFGYIREHVVKQERHHRHKKEKHGKETCHSNSKNGGGGNCNHQEVTVKAEQGCGAENHSSAGGCVQNTTTIVNNCGNVNTGTGEVNQGGNCNNGGTETCVGQNNCTEKHEECVNSSCNQPPPPPKEECGCKEKPEEPEKPKPTIKITSMTELNQIPYGRTSKEVHIGTYASESGGVLTVDPGIGSVSPCGSSTPQGTFTANVPSGSSEACVVFTAPEDADEPEYMVVTVTACIESVCAEKTQKVKVTYDQHPG